ncbi:MAG: hypothetical protein XD40_2122 [Archaeoglobus fulgidus]|uniref:Uncharacterized protein n=1 Tax=Archaeoglobus fulgidus TaxID=2234 RepID=A0A117KLI0_ARCFL|nr:hypothetical protein [Archaeoglobus fulgidus]KUJ92683.1 MAG: hypothetical protein XD40_2122 [Archaeoglobus fulgidus]KUK05965.1 MAG: Uncharacterized protein XD48_1800 [Archaeoglobus fulgidus]
MQKFLNFFVKIISYSYAIGLIILITMLGSPFALRAIYPLPMLPIYFPLAGSWGIVPYPLIIALSELLSPIGLVLYYLTLIPAIICQLLIIKMAVSREWDKIFEIMYLHHIVTGVLILSFTYIYPSIRDFQQGFDVFSVEYLPLALFGVYGFIVNFAASVAIKKWIKWYIEKG